VCRTATVIVTNYLHGSGRVLLVCMSAGVSLFVIFIERTVYVSNLCLYYIYKYNALKNIYRTLTKVVIVTLLCINVNGSSNGVRTVMQHVTFHNVNSVTVISVTTYEVTEITVGNRYYPVQYSCEDISLLPYLCDF